MSIFVKGVEMPTSCQECPLKHRGFNGSETVHYCYAICKEVSDDGEIDAACPLLPVPPHGRLGDLDSLALLVLNWISTQEKAYSHEDSNALAWRLGAKAMGNQIYRDIKAYPTVIPAEPEEEEMK